MPFSTVGRADKKRPSRQLSVVAFCANARATCPSSGSQG